MHTFWHGFIFLLWCDQFELLSCNSYTISRGHFSPKNIRKTPYSSPVRTRYCVSFVSSKPYWSFLPLLLVYCVKDRFTVGREISRFYSSYIRPICWDIPINHNNDVIMSAMASQITSLTIVYSSVYSGAEQRKHQSSASLDFVREIHRWPVNSPHKGPVTRKMSPFDDVIMHHRWPLTKGQ